MASTLPKLPIFEAIHKHDAKSTAILHYPSGRSFTYGELVHDVADAAEELRIKTEGKKLSGERVAFLVENGYDYVGAGDELICLHIHTDICSHASVHIRKPFDSCTAMYNVP
jgi:hypothetical protein